jgi:tRNA threonylcarbamoyladenosine biosynthesis protein TsaE
MVEVPTERVTVRSQSEARTLSIGENLGTRLDRGMCICVTGSLGSGKSVLVRGICRGLDVDESVISPSFILSEEYAGRLPVLHSDFYRLDHEREIEELGLFDRLDGHAVVLAEWGDRSPRMMREADMVIHLVVDGPESRTIEFHYRAQDAGLVVDL